LRVEEKFHELTSGGHLTVLPLAGELFETNELLSITKDIIGNYGIGFYVFNRDLVYCGSCQSTFYGELVRCPSCGSVNMLQSFSRV
jgi:ribonucleoside-triphosphate reductase